VTDLEPGAGEDRREPRIASHLVQAAETERAATPAVSSTRAAASLVEVRLATPAEGETPHRHRGFVCGSCNHQASVSPIQRWPGLGQVSEIPHDPGIALRGARQQPLTSGIQDL